MLIFYKTNIMKYASYQNQSLDSMQSPSNFEYKSQKLKKKTLKFHIEIKKRNRLARTMLNNNNSKTAGDVTTHWGITTHCREHHPLERSPPTAGVTTHCRDHHSLQGSPPT